MLFKPYYLIQAYSPKTTKLVTQYISTELSRGKQCQSLIEAKARSKEWAMSQTEAKRYNAVDWEPRVMLVTDRGKLPVTI